MPRGGGAGPVVERGPARGFLEEYYRVRHTQGIHNLYKFRLGTTAGDTRVTNIAIAPLVDARTSASSAG